MPDKETIARARKDKEQGKSPSTQAGEFVREEIHHIREGKHGARSARQAVAIGLSKARRAGVKLPPPKKGKASQSIRAKAEKDSQADRAPSRKVSRTRSRAALRALRREGHSAGSQRAVSQQSKAAAHRRTKGERSASAKKAARTRARER
jgi:hypothetical protein